MVCKDCRRVETVDVGVGDGLVVHFEERGVGDGIVEPNWRANQVPKEGSKKISNVEEVPKSKKRVSEVKAVNSERRKLKQVSKSDSKAKRQKQVKLKIKINLVEPEKSRSSSVQVGSSRVKSGTSKINSDSSVSDLCSSLLKSGPKFDKADSSSRKSGSASDKSGSASDKSGSASGKLGSTFSESGSTTSESGCISGKLYSNFGEPRSSSEKSGSSCESNFEDEFPRPVVENKRKRTYKKAECKVCGRTYKATYLKQHMQTHEEDKDKKRPYRCEKCEKRFADLTYYNNHQKICVNNESAFQCHICQKNLCNKQTLDVHVSSHSNERSFQCHQCAKLFKNYNTLHNHLKTHSDYKRYACDLCDKRFKVKKGLDYHKSRFHEGIIENFPCEMCEMVFHRRDRLKIHLDQHRGIKRHKCEECGKRFGSYNVWKTHLLIHKDQKKFSCTECGKGFNQGTDLKRHMSTHTGIKPFKCEECGRQFIHRVYLVRHKCSTQKTNSANKSKSSLENQNSEIQVSPDENDESRVLVNNEVLNNHISAMDYVNLSLNGSEMFNPLMFQSPGTFR